LKKIDEVKQALIDRKMFKSKNKKTNSKSELIMNKYGYDE